MSDLTTSHCVWKRQPAFTWTLAAMGGFSLLGVCRALHSLSFVLSQGPNQERRPLLLQEQFRELL